MNKSLLNTMQMYWWQHDDWQNENMDREANFSMTIFMGIIADI
jgi:fumarate reductase subunit C